MSVHLHGTVAPGHGVASGKSLTSPYPAGSVVMQVPFFKALGLDLSDFYLGTLNVTVAPARWTLLNPTHVFKNVKWTGLHPAETFSFLSCDVLHAGRSAKAWLYYPHPETKEAHWQDPSVLEIIAPRLEGLVYGDGVEIIFAEGTLGIASTQAGMA